MRNKMSHNSGHFFRQIDFVSIAMVADLQNVQNGHNSFLKSLKNNINIIGIDFKTGWKWGKFREVYFSQHYKLNMNFH